MKFRNIKKYKIQIIGLTMALAILLGGVLLLTTLAGVRVAQEQPVVASARTNYVAYVAKKDKTALAQLMETTDGVVTKNSSFGEYVDSIGTLKGGTDGKYWTFYVDGRMASVGAGTYVAKGGEKIEWKFEKAQ